MSSVLPTVPAMPDSTPRERSGANVTATKGFVGHTHYMGLSGSSLRTAIVLVSGLCFFCFGYGQGDFGGLMTVPSFRARFPEIDSVKYPTLHVSTIVGAVVATWTLGCFVGAVLTIFMADHFGRRGATIVGLVVMIIGKMVQVTTFSFGQYVVGRFLAGLGNGIISSTIPAWQAECLKTHRRGTLLMVSFGTCIAAGLSLAYWMDYAFSFTQPSAASWRVPIALVMIFMVFALALAVFLPESPRWLILTGREAEAKNVLSALSELSPDNEDIRREFLMIKHTLIHMSSGSLGQVFSSGSYRYRHRTLLAVLLQVMQQFTGINLFLFYLSAMFANQLKFHSELSLLLAACCSTELFLASLISVFGIDRFWGRRTLTMVGSTGMCICMVVLCVCGYFDTRGTHGAMAVMLFLYNTFFSIGWQGTGWLWAIELIPLRIRGPASALSTAANWLANFIVVLCTPIMFTNIGYKTYIVFAVTNFAIVPTIYLLYPETGFRSLEEVDVIFSQAGYLSVVHVAKSEPLWYDRRREHRSESRNSELGITSDVKKSADYSHSRGMSELASSGGSPWHAQSGSR